MLVKPKTLRWYNKLVACKTEHERMALMLRSGTEKFTKNLDLNTLEIWYVPCVGKFNVISLNENEGDLFYFKTDVEAIQKANELRQYIESKLNEFRTEHCNVPGDEHMANV